MQVPVHPVRSLAVPEAGGGEEEEAPGEDEETGRGGGGGGKGKYIFGTKKLQFQFINENQSILRKSPESLLLVERPSSSSSSSSRSSSSSSSTKSLSRGRP